MNTQIRRFRPSMVAVLLLLVVLAACGRDNTTCSSTAPHPRYEMDRVRDELSALPTPDGVGDDLFQVLKQALSAELDGRAKRPAVPIPEDWHFQVIEITALYEQEQWLLRWAYENDGDYNQDGMVTVSDITPLAVHFNEATDESGRWPGPMTQPVDGNGDGCISILDITPLAASFGLGVASYRIEGADEEAGPWETLDSVSFAEAIDDYGRLVFEVALGPAPQLRFFRVVPIDHSGSDQEASNNVDLEEIAPSILGVHPWSGPTLEMAEFTACCGGQQPLTYSWDFASGAEPSTHTDASPTVELSGPDDYGATLTVTNALGEAHYPFNLEVTPAGWDLQTVAAEPNEAQWPTSVAFAPDGQPSVAWWAWEGMDGGCVRFAHFDGSAWNPQHVDSRAQGPGYTLSLAYDGDGRPAIAYESPDNSQLVLARLQDDTWSIEDVPGTPEASHSDLAFDPAGRARIAYTEYSGGLSLATQQDEGWVLDAVEPASVYIRDCRLAVDSTSLLHLAYPRFAMPHATASDLVYARGDGGEWDFETTAEGVLSYGFDLALDSSELPSVVYGLIASGRFCFAYRDEESWHSQELPREPYHVAEAALAFAPSGRAVIALHSQGSQWQWLVVARQLGEGWAIEEVDWAPEALRGVDVAVSSSGRIAVSYETFHFDEAPSQVRIALLN